jgi:DNA-3-methyladenine glycosylase I
MKKRSSEKKRCGWQGNKHEAYIRYHDQEWGVPIRDDDVKQFEFLILEGAQAGLSWWTILSRREGYRRAFANFDAQLVARFTAKKVQSLMGDAGIIRNRQKIEAAIHNARRYLEVQDEFGSFNAYLWRFVEGRTVQNCWRTLQEVPATSCHSDALSKDLKHRGFKFVGSTIMYAHMQAAGLVNDHLMNCFRYQECRRLGLGR